ncbi:MAG: ergothioneine biosynthesis protein EgtB [Chitinophagales bacterium]|nr:ergothioneine biosynthesis protein EgtB [Chitinophagales bacterium]
MVNPILLSSAIHTDTELLQLFEETRTQTETICNPLEIEDYVIQPVEHVSPPKWHLGHTSWFFEELILKPYGKNFQPFNEKYPFIFNSYYENVGKRILRAKRGTLSRPTVDEIYDYRHFITQSVKDFILNEKLNDEIRQLIITGIHHEKQHQELLYTDIKYILGGNPMYPVYNETFKEHLTQKVSQEWIEIESGLYEIGHQDTASFCYDNELNPHKVYLDAYQISNRLVSNGEWIEFINDGGYKNFNFWHSDGWTWLQNNGIVHPLYWRQVDGEWMHYTMQGLQKVENITPVTHISYYEAFAYAQWKGCRLPTEFEWEVAQEKFDWGQRWEWTESAYLPYPGFRKAAGAVGEYNGKFMVDQRVLRGASVATPLHHARTTYRNFFQPYFRWQYTGLRLAK